MRATGGKLTISHLFQAYCVSVLHASPHPSSKSSSVADFESTFPPGEGFEEQGRNISKLILYTSKSIWYYFPIKPMKKERKP